MNDGLYCFSSMKIGKKQIQGHRIYALSPGLKRGKALILNFRVFESKDISIRKGSEKDVENLDYLFSKMGRVFIFVTVCIKHLIKLLIRI